MRRFFIIDYENTDESGVTGINCLKRRDHVEIFYSTGERIRLSTVAKMVHACHLKFTMLQNTASKNALDFLISSRVGMILQKYKHHRVMIVIVSKDNGYQPLKQMTGNKAEIRFVPSIMSFIDPDYDKMKEETADTVGTGACDTKPNANVNPENSVNKAKSDAGRKVTEADKILAFRQSYLNKLSRLVFGDYRNVVKDAIMTSNNKEELREKLVRKLAKGETYYQMLAETRER